MLLFYIPTQSAPRLPANAPKAAKYALLASTLAVTVLSLFIGTAAGFFSAFFGAVAFLIALVITLNPRLSAGTLRFFNPACLVLSSFSLALSVYVVLNYYQTSQVSTTAGFSIFAVFVALAAVAALISGTIIEQNI